MCPEQGRSTVPSRWRCSSVYYDRAVIIRLPGGATGATFFIFSIPRINKVISQKGEQTAAHRTLALVRDWVGSSPVPSSQQEEKYLNNLST